MIKMLAKFLDTGLNAMAKSQSKRKCYLICFAPEVPEELK